MQIQRAPIAAAACAAIGAVIGGAVSLRMPETYATSAQLRLVSTDSAFLTHAQKATAMEPLDIKPSA